MRFLLLSLLLWLPPSLCAAEKSEEGLAQGLKAIVAGTKGGGPALSGLQVVVIKEGAISFSGAYGLSGVEDDGRAGALEAFHKVRVASISKLVAAIGLMQLAEAGKVDLKDDVSSYFAFSIRNPNFPETPITVEQILSHTSSIRDGGRYWLPLGEDFSSFFVAEGKHYDNGAHYASDSRQGPGAYFEYSNLNFGIVAGIIEAESGQRFDLYMRDHVIRPLGLDSGFSPCDITINNPAALASTFRRNQPDGSWAPKGAWRVQNDGADVACYVGMAPTKRAIAHQELAALKGYALGSNPTLFSPQGGLRASANDLAVIMQMLLQKGRYKGVQLLKAETVAEMLKTRWKLDQALGNGTTTEGEKLTNAFAGLMAQYGLSVHITDLKNWGLTAEPRLLYGHLGEAYGLLGQFWFDPVSGDGFVALLTGTADNPEKYAGTTTPLYGPEEAVLRWWVSHFLQ